MMRVPNGDAVLRAWAVTLLGADYVWGQSDCLSLVTAGLQQLYPVPLPLPTYPSKRAALRALVDTPSLITDTLRALGATPYVLPFAQTGDVLVPPVDLLEPTVLLCLGGMSLTASPALGVHLAPTLALPPATRAWRLAHG